MRVRARALKRRVPGQMTQTEKRYAEHLRMRQLAGEIVTFAYEPETLRLARATTYKPDFRVVLADGTIEFHEVKSSAGFKAKHQDKSRVKLKIAAELHWMYCFRAAIEMKGQKGWTFEDLSEF